MAKRKSIKVRNMTVTYASGHTGVDVPMIRMQGAWLKDLGFKVGDKISVECQDGQIVIINKEAFPTELQNT